MDSAMESGSAVLREDLSDRARQATKVLRQHWAVLDCVVLPEPDAEEASRLNAYVVPAGESQASSRPELERQWLARSAQAWEFAYATAAQEAMQSDDPLADPYLVIHSWSGLPHRSDEIRELMEHTANRLRGLRPKRVLEIGCGSGQILSRLAPGCLEYWGADISSAALENLRLRNPLPHVTLLNRPADDLGGVPKAYFDGVILNSVLEFFPDIHYLRRVLSCAMEVVVPGGFIFIGDTCNYSLREVFHRVEQMQQAEAWQPVRHVLNLARKRFAWDQTLCVSPDFFLSLQQAWPQIAHVQFNLLRGRYVNPISQLHADTHYDTILHVGPRRLPVLEAPWLDWQREPLTVVEISQLLARVQPDVFGIGGIPHGRLQSHLHLHGLMPSSSRTAGELWDLARKRSEGEDLETWWNLEQQFPYQLSLSWSQSGQDALCDLVFLHRSQAAASPQEIPFPHRLASSAPLGACANNPIQNQLDQELASTLAQHLMEQMPGLRIPLDVFFVNSLPNPFPG